MENRRDFIKKAAFLSGAAGISTLIPDSILKAMSINPPVGTTYLDAEHVVILMQENRSFDHAYGSLQGVRGFNDPRAIRLPNGNPVWFQSNKKGDTYAPFRLNIKETKSTWLGSLPHSWTNQVDARNNGRYDGWLDAKTSGHKNFKDVPLALGYYNREDLPFYYALADAFTICDQNFCSSLTSTTPNRLYLWTGTLRSEKSTGRHAMVRNENVDYNHEANWKTFPERLEDAGVSWKIYQNELSLPTGFEGEEDAWLSNFTDNPMEWFSQYNVRFLPTYYAFLQKLTVSLPEEIKTLEAQTLSLANDSVQAKSNASKIAAKKAYLVNVREELNKWTKDNFEKLSEREKGLHVKAFTTNHNNPDYRKLKTTSYIDNGTQRNVQVPKSDVLYQFRHDVKNGNLPTVSWLVAPENFSDHPGAPWYGSWYLSEAMDILTSNPEVWKKTIFILCYDENDGYFDHVPPFVAPDPLNSKTGKVSEGIDAAAEFVTLAQDQAANPTKSRDELRESPIGLGYRVPLVIASPWSRGGAVCSQVFDHTSIIQFLEKFLTHKTGKEIKETNITAWRRATCGDLTSVFNPYNGETIHFPTPQNQQQFIEQIHRAQFMKDPIGYRKLSQEEIDNPKTSADVMPAQEKGIRPSTAIPYQLYADGEVNAATKQFSIHLSAKNEVFGARAAGSPFVIYGQQDIPRNYALKPGDTLTDIWDLDADGNYDLAVYGPNGFLRTFKGTADDRLTVSCGYQRKASQPGKLTGALELKLNNTGAAPITLKIVDNAYKAPVIERVVRPSKNNDNVLIIPLTKSHRWYDLSINIKGNTRFEYRLAGRIETGESGYTDPFMGGVS